MSKQVKFEVKLTDNETSQLMLLLTTMDIGDYRELAGSEDTARLMQSAAEKLRKKLTEQASKHRQYTEQTQGNNEFFRRLMHQSPISMQIYTPDAILREANQAFDELFHVSSDLLVGKYNVLKDPEVARIGAIPFLERVLAGGTVASHEFLYDAAKGMSEAGRKRWLRTRIYPIKDTHDKVINFVIAHEDITELKQYQENLQGLVEQRTKELSVAVEKLEVLSRTDGLTGLANRWHLDQVLDEELRRAKRQNQSVVVIIIDVDHFKKFNDQYGHQAGDDCLCSIAAILTAHSKRAGDLAARYGGEEFVLILPSASEIWGMTLAEAVRADVTDLAIPHVLSESGIVTISLGVAISSPDRAEEGRALLCLADTALYKAKAGGRNQTVDAFS